MLIEKEIGELEKALKTTGETPILGKLIAARQK